jgi:hypothetical protein
MTLHPHNPPRLKRPNRPTPRRAPRGERLAWRLVALLTDYIRLRGWG